MFDFNKVESTVKIDKAFILSKLSDAQIFRYYFGHFDLNTSYKSKFIKDNTPSTGFYISKSGKLIYNHLNGKVDKMDCFAFVQHLFNLDFKGTVNKIAYDFGLVSGNPAPVNKKVLDDLVDFDRDHKKETKISIIAAKWTDTNSKFWSNHEISIDELKREGVYPIKKLFINEKPISNPNDFIRYALTTERKKETLIKVYSPNPEDKFKWVNNIPLDHPFGIQTLNKTADYCVVTKSVKDMIILKKFFPAVIASQNESRSAISDSTMANLNRLFQFSCLAWDIDDTGLEAMTEMEEFGFVPMHLPIEFFEEGIKDFGDFVLKYGLKELDYIIQQIKP